jgi:hypothetical protein
MHFLSPYLYFACRKWIVCWRGLDIATLAFKMHLYGRLDLPLGSALQWGGREGNVHMHLLATLKSIQLLLVCCAFAVSGWARTCVVCHWFCVPLFLDLSQQDSRIMVTCSICDVPVPLPLKLILCPLL